MLIITFDSQEEIGNSGGQTCENIFISCKSPTWRHKKKTLFGILHLCLYYAVVTSKNRRSKILVFKFFKFTEANVFYSCSKFGIFLSIDHS